MNWKTHAFAALVAVCLLGSLTGCATDRRASDTVNWDDCRPSGKHITTNSDGEPTFRYTCGQRVVVVTYAVGQKALP